MRLCLWGFIQSKLGHSPSLVAGVSTPQYPIGSTVNTMHEPGKADDRFDPGADTWLSGLGLVRDAVRQELVRRQLCGHLPGERESLLVLDAGCGQGTQAIQLARLGHRVVGVDLSGKLLNAARAATADEPNEVRQRLDFRAGDLLALSDEHRCRYDLVCCHGVAMYLPSLSAVVSALAAASRPGGIISLVTRNRAGIAMRAGMTGAWTAALEGFHARHYDNRLGIEDVRADEPGEVQDALTAAGATTLAWYGVRLFTDHWGRERPGDDFSQLLDAEEEAGRRDPYRSVAALTHTIARQQDPTCDPKQAHQTPAEPNARTY
jgi:S-adenosylmethionine-dependent methyltransferase